MDGREGRIERLFLVRLWREAGMRPDDPPRTTVRDLAGGERLAFGDPADLTDFLRNSLSGDSHRAR